MLNDHSTSGAKLMNDTVSFLIKIIVLSALLSLAIKYGGPLLPLSAPFADLNGLVTVIVVLPSIVIGIALLAIFKNPSQKV